MRERTAPSCHTCVHYLPARTTDASSPEAGCTLYGYQGFEGITPMFEATQFRSPEAETYGCGPLGRFHEEVSASATTS